jgi:putative PEP-CTERM system histidine kinase
MSALWIYNLNLYTLAYLGKDWPSDLFRLQSVVLILTAPVFGISAQKGRPLGVRLSRAAAFQSVSLVAIGAYLIAMAVVTAGLQMIEGEVGRLAQISFVFAASLFALLLGPSAKFRAWFRVKVSKHLFQHRYDYRSEWLRFTGTLGRPEDRSADLGVRVVQAIADILEAPSGLLLTPDQSGVLLVRSKLNWHGEDLSPSSNAPGFSEHLAQTGRVVELDSLRSPIEGEGSIEAALVPDWILADPTLWVIVPLVHFDRLTGLIVLARPPLSRSLDWEDFDLLRVVGRQGASYLAEANSQEQLSEARRFDEFNRRFAFIMHDVKNLVSQLSLLTRNAERHADNPEFRADMIETLKNSTARMNALLARLSQHNKGKAAPPRVEPLAPLLDRIVNAKRAQHDVLVKGDKAAFALFDPARLEQALGHLVQNAIEASDPAKPVTVAIVGENSGTRIDVIDTGCGMSAEFLGTKLFKPFTSTKEGGFGIGTFEARSDLIEMGAQLSVSSKEGEGTTFSIHLPNPIPTKTHTPEALAA